MTRKPKISYYESTKTFTHAEGWSCVFRQWRASSHCRFLHGYALQVKITFGCHYLDETNWVQDFGGLKALKEALKKTFDHTLLVARDDPNSADFLDLDRKGLAQVVVLESVGCEAFAKYVFDLASVHVETSRLYVVSAEVSEHPGNSAIYRIEVG